MVNHKQGDIIYLDFDPQAGHEQKGRRPAIVVSKTSFNARSSVTMVCPITHTQRPYPTCVALPEGIQTDGYVLCEQARFLDLHSRNANFVEATPDGFIKSISDIIIALIEVPEADA
ncbi:MAG: type II toxin-antitoxin system PemK/MazF family toxin [Clostridia bacterium]|nr:type II toxin-antitoxin system PemK/MazF family toxin [Clostridia bacterium]